MPSNKRTRPVTPPPLDKVLVMKEISELALGSPADDNVVNLKKGVTVFVPHPGTPLNFSTGNYHWKMLVDSIHTNGRGNNSNKTWVIGRWFYSADDLEHHHISFRGPHIHPRDFGDNEVVLSNHRDVISACTIDDDEAVISIDDRDVFGLAEDQDEKSFYYRGEVDITESDHGKNATLSFNKTCICNMPYIPSQEVQRFCRACQSWYHVSCCKSFKHSVVRDPALVLDDLNLAQLKELAFKVPIMRGYKAFDSTGLLAFAGNGSLVKKVASWRELVEDMEQDDDEQELLEQGRKLYPTYIWNQLCVSTYPVYSCPSCNEAL